MSELPATVVLRTAGERTAELARRIVESQVPSDHVFVIREVPFARAVERTFEIGIECGRKWTIALDADVLLAADAIERLVSLANRSADDVFELEGRLFDKLFGGPRWCGLHLYRTSFLVEAIEIAKQHAQVHRPEYHVIVEMQKRGFRQQRQNEILGLHDFEQSSSDYFRKGFVHAQKHSRELSILAPMWHRCAEFDPDFEAAILGMNAGADGDKIATTDIRKFDQSSELFNQFNLAPKSPIDLVNVPLDYVDVELASLIASPEFARWERHAMRVPLRDWLHQSMRLGIAAIPSSLRDQIRKCVEKIFVLDFYDQR